MGNGSLRWLATRFVAPNSVLAALTVLESHGHDRTAARRAGKLPADFEAAAPRISFLAAGEVWRHVVRVCRDPALGIRTAEVYLQRDPSLVAYLIRTSPTLTEGLRHKARFTPILDELCRCDWIENGETGTYRFAGSAEFYLPAVAEFAAARLVGAVRCLSSPGMNPLTVRFMHDPPRSTTTQRGFFRSRLEYRAPAIEVVFPLRPLRCAVATSDPALHRLLLHYAEQKLADAVRPRSNAERVREIVMQAWQQGQGEIPSRTQIARMLRVTPRTLGRWLEADGRSYSDLIDEFRALAATRSLQRPETSLVHLAQLLGFKDQSAFTHAFRRWTGMTPGQYRRLHGRTGE